jgi:hypothetical protein
MHPHWEPFGGSAFDALNFQQVRPRLLGIPAAIHNKLIAAFTGNKEGIAPLADRMLDLRG